MRTSLLLIITALSLPLCAQVSVIDARMNTLSVNLYITTGAEQSHHYIEAIRNLRVGIVANHTSVIHREKTHLVDALIEEGLSISAVFAPEHGFRGEAGAGEKVNDSRDAKTGLEVRSLYGKTKKPTPEMLADVDVLLFDMQDVGARFYTYLSTLHYVMEAAAEQGKPLIVLDRPNPNGFYTDGPVLDMKFSSFVGMHPIPMVHGMTLGELAQMINGQGWLKGAVKCDLTVVPCRHYKRNDLYTLPVDPSPNLMSMEAVYLYPSLCLFEPTVVSIGRGTLRAFEVYGHPDVHFGSFVFTPESIPGKAPNPKHLGKDCHGVDLHEFGSFYFKANQHLYLDWLIGAYRKYEAIHPGKFFTDAAFFDKLAGTDQLRSQLVSGHSAEAIRKSWEPELKRFLELRAPYLLYP